MTLCLISVVLEFVFPSLSHRFFQVSPSPAHLFGDPGLRLSLGRVENLVLGDNHHVAFMPAPLPLSLSLSFSSE